jgi:putative MATE family efflux protein
MGAQSVMGLIETWYVSRLGADALAGMALVFPTFMLLQMISAGAVGGGILSTTARAIGAGDLAGAERVVWAAFAVTLLLTLPTSAAALLFGRDLYRLLGGEGPALDAAFAYATVAFAGALPLWLFNSLAAIVRAQGNVVFPAAVVVGGTLLLMPVSPLLIFGFGPLPGLGIAGGAWAIVLFYVAGSLVLAWHVWSGRGVLRPSVRPTRPPVRAVVEILRIGTVSSLNAISTNVVIAIALTTVASLDSAAVAGYGTGVRLEYLLIPLVFGIGVPTAAIVGTSIGAGLTERALRVTWAGALIAGLVTELIGVAAALASSTLMGFFTDDTAVIASGSTYLRTVGPFFGFYGAGLALYFAAQGAGRVALPQVSSIARIAIVTLLGPIAIELGGEQGLYATLAVAMVVYCLLNLLATALPVHRRPTTNGPTRNFRKWPG